MRTGSLLAVTALHGLAWLALGSGVRPSGSAPRQEMQVRLLPAVAVPAAAPRVTAPTLSLPALAAVAPLAFNVEAGEARAEQPAEIALVSVAAAPVAAPPPPARDEPATAEPAVQPARRAACAPAPHPLALRERGVEGVVRLRVWVDELGRAGQVLLAGSSGWRLFDDAAVAQARRCPFQPALRGAQPVGSWVEFPVRFALETSNG
jgi:protein TonB